MFVNLQILHFCLWFEGVVPMDINDELTIRSGSLVSRLELDHPAAFNNIHRNKTGIIVDVLACRMVYLL